MQRNQLLSSFTGIKTCRYFASKSRDTFFQARKKVNPTDLALQHFDSYYSKVYGRKWPSIRVGLLSPHKYAAILNSYLDVEEVVNEFKLMRKVNLAYYYEKHWKQAERHRLRKSILDERIKKKENENQINKDSDNELSGIDENISESEFRKRDLGFSSAAEDAHRMFESEFEDNTDRYLNSASTTLNLNDFVPTTELKYEEDERLMVNESYNSLVPLDIPIREEPRLIFPNSLKVYMNPRGVIGYENLIGDEDSEEKKVLENAQYIKGQINCFPHPQLDKSFKIWNYYVMDAASILPVLCLNIQPGDIVGDYCAAPGGKALAMLLSSQGMQFHLNDLNKNRFFRLRNVISNYIPKNSEILPNIKFSETDGTKIIRPDFFDKILLDAPCSNDRISVQSNDSSLFLPKRLKERVQLPDKQIELLKAALRSIKVNGSVVYSTCTLSPMQNDRVVQTAISSLMASSHMQFELISLKETLRPLRGLFKMHSFFYGQQILPFVPSNTGPMYICKILRTK